MGRQIGEYVVKNVMQPAVTAGPQQLPQQGGWFLLHDNKCPAGLRREPRRNAPCRNGPSRELRQRFSFSTATQGPHELAQSCLSLIL
jgi:hypothetical protein